MATQPDLASSSDPVERTGPPSVTFELSRDEDAGEGLRRIVVEQLALALWHTQRIGDASSHVHEARKATKRIRSILRMVRDEIGSAQYRDVNTTVRDVARELSDLRTAIVRVETLEGLVEGDPSLAIPAEALTVALASDVDRLKRSVAGDRSLIEDMGDRLVEVRDTVTWWKMPSDFDPTSNGLRRTYRRGRRGMARAYDDASAESFHRWRKEVKYLRHQVETLAGVLTEGESTFAADLEELGDGLGAEHDLVDLLDTIVRDRHGVLIAAIDVRRREILSELRPVGARVYSRSPGEFATDMETAWQRWHGTGSLR